MFFWNSLAFFDLMHIGNLISGSSAFSKSSLNISKFTVHILLKPGLENFEHYFTSVWDECSCVVVWAFFDITFLWDWNENWPFPVLWPLLFQICWHVDWSTFTASSFRIWNSSTGIPSPPLALFAVMLPKAHVIHIPGCLALGDYEWSHHRDYLSPEVTIIIFKLFLLSSL